MEKTIIIEPSNRKNKKFKIGYMENNKMKFSHFGDSRYEDYTIHKDPLRKKRYINRHKKEDWSNPFSPGTLSRYILWNKPTLLSSIDDYANRFNLKILL